MRKWVFVGLGLWVVGLGLWVGPVVAQAGEPPTVVEPGAIPELPAFLELLAGPAGWVALGVWVSMVLAKWHWYNTQASGVKNALAVGITAALSVLAQGLLVAVPAEVWASIAPYWAIVAGAVMTWMGSQAWYVTAVRGKSVSRHWTWSLIGGEDDDTMLASSQANGVEIKPTSG